MNQQQREALIKTTMRIRYDLTAAQEKLTAIVLELRSEELDLADPPPGPFDQEAEPDLDAELREVNARLVRAWRYQEERRGVDEAL